MRGEMRNWSSTQSNYGKRMFSLTNKTAIISTLLVVGFAANFQVKAFDSPVGEWTYREVTMEGHLMRGKMSFIDKSNATYTANNGRLIFNATDDKGKWEGFWIEDGINACFVEKDGSYLWGVAIFQFSEDYSQFEGTWDMCGDDKTYSWTGFR